MSKTGPSYTFRFRCDGLSQEDDVDELVRAVEAALPINWRTFLQHVSRRELAPLFPMYDWGEDQRGGLRMSKDWAVAYYRSTWYGQTCYYVEWSAYEYVFLEEPNATDAD